MGSHVICSVCLHRKLLLVVVKEKVRETLSRGNQTNHWEEIIGVREDLGWMHGRGESKEGERVRRGRGRGRGEGAVCTISGTGSLIN